MEILLLCLPLAVGGLAAVLTMDAMAQYSALPKPPLAPPPLAPPPWVFPVAWTALYLLMGLASRRIYRLHTAESRRALRLHYAQLGANFVWPLLFFRAGEYAVAFWWLLFLLALAAAEMASFRRLDRTAGRLLAPYLAWLAFAAYLNYAVVRLTA